MKKKWLYGRCSIENDIRLAISKWLIRFACSLRERKSGSFEWLQMLGKKQQPKDYDTTRKTGEKWVYLKERTASIWQSFVRHTAAKWI